MRGRGIAVGMFLVVAAACPRAGAGAPLAATWGPDHRSLCFDFLGRRTCYPDEVLRAAFPRPGAEPEFSFTQEWPLVSMIARWSVSTNGWPEKYRPDALDLVVMYACDAGLYEYVFPQSIRASSFTYPPDFLREAADSRYDLAEALRGKEVAYEVTARGGFGASDYMIKTSLRIGVSADGKTAFYHDHPSYISDYLTSRDFFFAGRDAGDRLVFEVRMLCECAPAHFFKGETMRRIAENGRYFVRRLHEDLKDPPTAGDIETYFRFVKAGKQSYGSYLKDRGLPLKNGPI